RSHADKGVEIFTFGRISLNPDDPGPVTYPARQTLESSSAVARLHQLNPTRTLFIRQNPQAIDSGAFHNDVVSVGNENVLLFHEKAFADAPATIEAVRRVCTFDLHLIEVKEADVPLTDAIDSYLFNSQLVTLPDRSMAIIAPIECRENPRVAAEIQRILA